MKDALATCEWQRAAIDHDLTLALCVLSVLMIVFGAALYVMWVKQ